MQISGEGVGRRLRECADAKNLNQAQVTRDLGFGSGTLSRYFSGASVPKSAELLTLAQYFGVSMEWLLTGQERDAEEMRVREREVPYEARDRVWLREVAEKLGLLADEVRGEISGTAADGEDEGKKADSD